MRRSVVAIGIFDGVHRGHQKILRHAVSRARRLNVMSVAVTFDPHPLAVLKPAQVPSRLVSLPERLRRIRECGIRRVEVIPFTPSFSRWSPDRFVRQVLVERLGAREVVVGTEFRFGAGRAGTVRTLEQLGGRYGFKVQGMPPVLWHGRRISSQRIRGGIARGELAAAAGMLGRPVLVCGRVVRGAGRGRKIGTPTANLYIEEGLPPPPGVYAVQANLNRCQALSAWHRGMANFGRRPTFTRKGPLLLEVHLFGHPGRLYGRRLQVRFLKRLRPERKFPSAEALARQLARDASQARRISALQGSGRVV